MDVVEKIKLAIEQFMSEATKQGNQAAAKRARKVSLELEKLLKQYRKESV